MPLYANFVTSIYTVYKKHQLNYMKNSMKLFFYVPTLTKLKSYFIPGYRYNKKY